MIRKIALAGIGAIARTQHIPALNDNPDWMLAATVSQSGGIDGVENFTSIHSLLDARPDISVVSLCVPPSVRFDMAVAVLESSRHLMLEKPPGATVRECQVLATLAAKAGVTLFATWHSREAETVDFCRAWLADKTVEGFTIHWQEDVRRWHPGQEWIWQPGGLGVFDPGINALSILTKILPDSVLVTAATLETPRNRQTPIAAHLQLKTSSGASGTATFDWRQAGDQVWEILIDTTVGRLHLTDGGAGLAIDGVVQSNAESGVTLVDEYPRLYRRLTDLIEQRQSDCDVTPLQLVADAFMVASHNTTDPFEF